MNSKNKKKEDMGIVEYTEEIFKSCGAKGASQALNYATGLMVSPEKSIVKIINKLGLEISAKSFLGKLKEFFREVDRAKVLFRIGIFMDRRKNVYVITDDTPGIMYGKKVFAAAYQHNNTFNARLWQDTIVDCAIFYKETRLYVPEVGYLKFFRCKEENEEEEYIATTKLDMLPKSAYRHKKMEWKILEMHEDLKSYFGLEECYSGKKETYYAVFSGGEGLFLTTLRGPGKIIIQSMTLHNLASALAPFLPSAKGTPDTSGTPGVFGTLLKETIGR